MLCYFFFDFCLVTFFFFFFNDTATTEIYTLSLHDALPISRSAPSPHPLAAASPTSWHNPVKRWRREHLSYRSCRRRISSSVSLFLRPLCRGCIAATRSRSAAMGVKQDLPEPSPLSHRPPNTPLRSSTASPLERSLFIVSRRARVPIRLHCSIRVSRSTFDRSSPEALNDRTRHRCARPAEKLRHAPGCAWVEFAGGVGRSVRLPRRQWQRQDDDDPHALRPADTGRRQRNLPWVGHPLGCAPYSASGRLHDATLQPLRRSHSVRKPRFRGPRLSAARPPAGGTEHHGTNGSFWSV